MVQEVNRVDVVDNSQQFVTTSRLIIDGLVEAPQTFTPEALASLARISRTEDFHCDHKGTALGRVWRGISLREIIQLAQPQSAAKYIRVHAQNYSVPLLLTEIDGALLVDSIDGQLLNSERGTPWRLYVPGAQCQVSVKWVNRLQLTATRGATPTERIERARERGVLP
jgi:DMSO/TMAO reductase YedYZ molybdopterin-dependent catalytic subunit